MTIGEFVMNLGFKTDKGSESKVKSDINGLKSFAKKALGVIAVGVSIVKVNDLMNEFGAINDQVSKINDGLMSTEEAAEMMKSAANDCYMSYADMVTAVSDVRDSAKDIFTNNQEAATFVNLTTKAFRSAKASESEVTALQQSLNKSFSEGSMQLDTLENMVKAAPDSVKYLTDAFGVSEDALVTMCKNGQISSRQLADAFIMSADDINKNFEDVNLKITDGIKVIRNDFGKFVSDLNDSTKVTTRITRMMLNGWKTVNSGLKAIRPTLEQLINFGLRIGEGFVSAFGKIGEWIGKVAEKLGGVDNMLKIVAIAAAALFVVMNFQKIVSGIKMVLNAMGGFNPKVLLIVAVITLLVLLIEDFINFMQGNDSLMGSIFESMGINAEEVRNKIKSAWNAVKTFLANAWNFIVELATTIVGKLKDFWTENGDSILAAIKAVWEFIKSFLAAVWRGLITLATSIGGKLKSFWSENGQSILGALKSAWNTVKSILSGVWKALVTLATTLGNSLSDFWAENGQLIMETLSNIWNVICSLLSTLWNIISTVAMAVFNTLKAFWDEWGATVTAAFSVLWETLISLIQPFLDFLEGLITFLNGVFSGDWEQAWEGIKKMVQGAVDFIKNIINGLKDAIKLIFGQIIDSAVTWGSDFIDGIVKGIRDGIARVKQAATDVANSIKSVLHFSVPDEGPLTDYESWMPDFADGLVRTLTANKGKIKNAAMDIAGALNIKPTYQTALNAQGVNKAGNTVNQNVEISNKYEVTERSMAGKASKAMSNATTDITKQLAQGLAYGRG